MKVIPDILLTDETESFILQNGYLCSEKDDFYVGTTHSQIVLHKLDHNKEVGSSVFLDPTTEHYQIVQHAIELLIESMSGCIINWYDSGAYTAISDYAVMTHISAVDGLSVVLTACEMELDAIPDMITLPPTKNSLDTLTELLRTIKRKMLMNEIEVKK